MSRDDKWRADEAWHAEADPHNLQRHPTYVFCRDCQWYGGAVTPRRHVCRHAHARYMQTTPIGRIPARYAAEERNTFNDCPDFQPARFWPRLWHTYGLSLVVMLGLWGALFVVLCAWRRGL
jgi:hypothetical protein